MTALVEHRTAPATGRIAVSLQRISPSVRVLLFAAFLAAGGAFMLYATPGATTTPERAWGLPFFGLVIAFGVAEATALHVEIRKESHSLSLSAIPLMFGVLYLSPAMLALAYLAGALPAMLWIRRLDPLKAIWNACLFFAEAALVGLIVRVELGEALPDTAVEWLVPLAAVLVAELMSLIAVPLVIMLVDATFRPQLFAAVGRSQVLAALAGTFTVTALSASVADPAMLVYALIPVIGIGALLQSAGKLSQRFEDLQQLHRFTRSLANDRTHRTVDIGLEMLVEIMRCRTACLLTVDDDEGGAPRVRALVDDRFEDIDPTSLAGPLLDIVDSGAVAHLTINDERPEVRDVLRELRASRVVAAPVLGEVGRRGVLFITDRLGMRPEFSADEIRLFGSLADTMSGRLANDHLVDQLEILAQHDSLTGLPNRLSFEVALAATLDKPGSCGVLVMIDLDRFKEINDSLGHETGDRLLVEVAGRLRKSVRASDMVARLGGDEFALLLTSRSADEPGEFTRRINDLRAELVSKVELDGISFEIGASLGVVQWPDQGTDTVSLFRRADTAMYEAKRNQLGIVWFTSELDDDAPRRMELSLSARAALENEEMCIRLQPKVSTKTGRITGAEALIRWSHPSHGDVSPLEFVPLLTQAGLTRRLTRFVIERAVQTAATFELAGLDIPIAVNLTARDLLDPTLPDDIAEILRNHDVGAESLLVEITEHAMVVDFDTSVDVLGRVRALGVKVAIDDFGTGYSSLQHLHALPVDELKIDRSFVSRVGSDPSAAAIVSASVNLARDLDLTTVAEGIEDHYSAHAVAALGCDEIQGFVVARPLAADEFMRWANEWTTNRCATRDEQSPWASVATS